MNSMMNQLKHIQDYLNGKSKEEVNSAIATKKIDYDDKKYKLSKSDRTVSGYVAEFTDYYKKEMQKILGNIIASHNVYIKLDSILSDGFVFDSSDKIELYVSSEDIFFGNGLRKVFVYTFKKDEEIRELLVADGELVKGSLSMATRSSDFIESKYEDLLNRQEYASDVLGVNVKLAAFITTKLRTLDDDAFDKAIEDLLAMSKHMMSYSSIVTSNNVNVKENLYHSNRNKVRNTIDYLVGGNEEYRKLLRLLIDRHTSTNVESTRDILVSGMKQVIWEFIMDEDIEEYRSLINTFGKHPNGYTKDISIVADLTDMSLEILKFLFRFGNQDDFEHFMTQTIYNTKSKKVIEDKDDYIIELLYESLKDNVEKLNISVSHNYVNDILTMIDNSDLKDTDKETLKSKFTLSLANNKSFEYSVKNVLADILKSSLNREEKAKFVKVVLNTYTENELQNVFNKYHPLMNISDKLEQLEQMIDGNISFEKFKNKLAFMFGNYKFESDSLIVENKITNMMFTNMIPLNEKIQTYIDNNIKFETFKEECTEIFKDIVQNGITNDFEKKNIIVTIKQNDEDVMVLFEKGSLSYKQQMNELNKLIYHDKTKMSKVKDNIDKIYKEAQDILENDSLNDEDKQKQLYKLFFSKGIISPDTALAKAISNDEEMRLASKDSSEATHIMNENGQSLKVSTLLPLQMLVRKTYLNTFKYENMLTNKQGLFFNNLFTPIVYSIETGEQLILSNATATVDGNIFIDAEKILHSDNIESIYQEIESNRIQSRRKVEEYFAIKQKEKDYDYTKDFTAEKIQFVEDRVELKDICKQELFVILHDVIEDESQVDWLRKILNSIDQYSVQEFKTYEKKLEDNKNTMIANL